MAYKVFTNGSVLQASEINDNLMRQSVMVFSNAAARTAAITSPTEGMITYLEDVDRFESRTASAWVPMITPGSWTAYTPSFSGVTVGNGIVDFDFTQIGKTVITRGYFRLGSTSSVSGNILIGTPVTALTATGAPIVGSAIMNDTGTDNYIGMVNLASTGLFGLYSHFVSGTTIRARIANSSTPFTWVNTDEFAFYAVYEGA